MRLPYTMDKDHRRLIVNNFLSPDTCKELEFIHKSCGTIGYRPNVLSTTLAHLAFTNCAHLILPFVSIRERVLEKVEEFFGCQYGLVIEFTGLISWTKGASIGWHSDDNRPYLKQRHYAAVCYLNSYNKDFKGGLFHFQHGEPSTVIPMAGDVVMYTADDENIHSVDEITEGERVTLTLWFSRDQAHNEDEKVISFLSQRSLDNIGSYIPVPAPNSMYWFPPDEASTVMSGFDIRYARLFVLGLDLYSPASNGSSSSSLELLMCPVQIAKENELFHMQFSNILHVLQVVQFYCWKEDVGLKAATDDVKEPWLMVKPLSGEQHEQIDRLRQDFLLNDSSSSSSSAVEDRFVSCGRNRFRRGDVFVFRWDKFCAAVAEWECYSQKLCEEVVRMLPLWRKHASIFYYPPPAPAG